MPTGKTTKIKSDLSYISPTPKKTFHGTGGSGIEVTHDNINHITIRNKTLKKGEKEKR